MNEEEFKICVAIAVLQTKKECEPVSIEGRLLRLTTSIRGLITCISEDPPPPPFPSTNLIEIFDSFSNSFENDPFRSIFQLLSQESKSRTWTNCQAVKLIFRSFPILADLKQSVPHSITTSAASIIQEFLNRCIDAILFPQEPEMESILILDPLAPSFYEDHGGTQEIIITSILSRLSEVSRQLNTSGHLVTNLENVYPLFIKLEEVLDAFEKLMIEPLHEKSKKKIMREKKGITTSTDRKRLRRIVQFWKETIRKSGSTSRFPAFLRQIWMTESHINRILDKI